MPAQIRGDDASRHVPEKSGQKKSGPRAGNPPADVRNTGCAPSKKAARDGGALPVERLDSSNDEYRRIKS
jgi:hypothetical protein